MTGTAPDSRGPAANPMPPCPNYFRAHPDPGPASGLSACHVLRGCCWPCTDHRSWTAAGQPGTPGQQQQPFGCWATRPDIPANPVNPANLMAGRLKPWTSAVSSNSQRLAAQGGSYFYFNRPQIDRQQLGVAVVVVRDLICKQDACLDLQKQPFKGNNTAKRAREPRAI